jgi:glycosyltransferase involved in cell wall biosynthesis
VLFLPPVAWLPDQHSHQQDISPDTAELFRLLAAEGITSHIFDPLQRPWNPLARCHPLLRSIDPLRALYVLLRYRRVDTVVCVFEGSALLLALLRRACRFRPRLLMWDIGLTESWRLRRWLQNLLVPRLDEILVLGTNQVGEISARWPRHAAVTCIGHYTDTTFFRPLPPSEGSDGYVLAVGDDEGRDYPTLLAAVAGLAADCVVRTHQLLPLDPVRDARVRPIVERLSFPALRELYADAAVIVVPLAERPRAGGVTAVLEAAAMGRAAVVSASSGVRDWCRDGETCLMVPCGDAAAMRAAIQRLLEDTELRTRLGRNARTFAENECSTAAFAVRLARRL